MTPRADEWRKWEHLRDAAQRDASDPRVRHTAKSLFTAALGRPRTFAALALALCQEGIRYQLDRDRLGREDVAGYGPSQDRTSFDAYERAVDDCDAKSRLFVAICVAGGLPAELVPVWLPDGSLQHVAARVRLDGAWQHAEPTLRRGLMGEAPDAVPRETSGQWLQ